MGISATIAAVGAVVGGVSYANGKKQLKAQKSAQSQAQRNADSTAQEADRANNRANMRKPDVIGLLGGNMSANSMGFGSTFLTGATGQPLTPNTVGKNTLLGL